jgi:hypothetical protein
VIDPRRSKRRLTEVGRGTTGMRCAECGADEFSVITILESTTSSVVILRCEDDTALAAIHFTKLRIFVWQRGTLAPDLRVVDEVVVDRSEGFDQFSLVVRCSDCIERRPNEAWVEVFRSDKADEPEFTVRCAACHHEVAYGWSHGYRIGRIVPITSPEFIPGVTHLDPKFEGRAGTLPNPSVKKAAIEPRQTSRESESAPLESDDALPRNGEKR